MAQTREREREVEHFPNLIARALISAQRPQVPINPGCNIYIHESSSLLAAGIKRRNAVRCRIKICKKAWKQFKSAKADTFEWKSKARSCLARPPPKGRGFACDFSRGSLVTSQFGSLVTSCFLWSRNAELSSFSENRVTPNP